MRIRIPVLASRGLAALLLPVLAVVSAARPSDPVALDRGLATIDPGEIRSDLVFLASDELGGRDTPSHGLRIAARYLRARVETLGFTPAGDDGGFFAHYGLVRRTIDPELTSARIVGPAGEVPIVFGKDYAFRTSGPPDGSWSGPVVYAGRSVDELRAVDLGGAWALVVRDREVDRGERQRAALEGGAIGLLEVADPSEEGDPLGERAERALRFAGRGLQPEDAEAGAFPESYLARAAAEALLGGAGLPAPGTRLASGWSERRAEGADTERHELENVVALWPGSDPVLGREVILVSAHYDHVGTREGEIYNGADDNASGTSGLLALAEALRDYGPMRRSVCLIWVSGEEKGLRGSAAWTRSPTLPDGYHPVADVNIDMIGRNAPDSLLITPTADHAEYNGLTRLAERLAPGEGFTLGSADEYWHRSDHANFAANLGIPVAFLFSDVHEDYHKPTDTADKIDYDKASRVVRLVLGILDGLQDDELRL